MKTKQPSLPTMKSTKNKDKTKKKPVAPAGDTLKSVGHQTGPHAQSSPTRAQWLRLYRAADAFYKLAPWEWMDDDRIFGVQCPETGKIHYCCVLGAMKEVFALIAYEGTEGLEGYLKMLSGEVTIGPMISEYQLCLEASFNDRTYLAPRDLAVIRDLGLKYRGRNAWPLFRHHMPGFFPWHLSAVQAGTLATCLEQAIDVLPRCAENRQLLTEPDTARHFVRVLEASSDGEAKWLDKMLAPAPLKQKAPEDIPINEIAIARLRRSPKKKSGDWEIGYAYAPTASRSIVTNAPTWRVCWSLSMFKAVLCFPWDWRRQKNTLRNFVKLSFPAWKRPSNGRNASWSITKMPRRWPPPLQRPWASP